MANTGGGPQNQHASRVSSQGPGAPRVSLDIKIEGVTSEMLNMTLLNILQASGQGGPGGGGEDPSTAGSGSG